MGQWQGAWWHADEGAPSREGRRSGAYRTYAPDGLLVRGLRVAADVHDLAWRAEAEVRRLGDRPGSRGLEALARFLLRSEAIASSRIEGLHASPQQVGLAELAQEEGLARPGASSTAGLVAANIAAIRHATLSVAREPAITIEHIEALQKVLLSAQPRLQELRDEQNWIGGSDYHPLDAEFVPPAPEAVRGLMEDLTTYMNGGTHAPLVQAGLVHAQFETIHPFRDGNGRVGRALIHAVLVRRGLTRTAVLPISLVLLTRSDDYIDGLTAYRYEGPDDSPAAEAAVSAWLRHFLAAVSTAVDHAGAFADQLDDLRQAWEAAVSTLRTERGLRAAPRADSATAKILTTLQENPVLTTGTVSRLFGVSDVAARQALDELADATVLRRRSLDRRSQVYLAMDVFELLTLTERRMASTRWTQEARPSRGALAAPEG